MNLTKEELEAIKQGDLAWKEQQRKDAIKNIFTKEGIDYELGNYNFFKRCFLWLKALICLITKRTNASYLDKNSFCIISYNETYDMCGSSWQACWISSDYFKGWNICIGTDGT